MMGAAWTSSMRTEEDQILASELFLAYQKAMYRIAFEILKNQEDAEDAVMNAAMNICRDFGRIKQLGTEERKARILAIAKNAATDIYRKNRKRGACRGDMCLYLEGREEKGDSLEGTLEIFAGENAFGRLQKYVLQLKEKYQHILVMKYYDEMSNKEIAEQLHLPESTVGTQLQRAKQILQQTLEEGEVRK